MTPFLLGRKIGMTQVFNQDGTVIPVTVLQAGPCVVTQVKTAEKDGYTAVQLGFETAKRLSKPEAGHFKNSDHARRHLAEVRLDEPSELAVGAELNVDQFKEIKTITVSGVSKGKGFAGVIKRHGFSRGPETHGSDHHRRPGSIGGMFPQRVLKGQRMPGHLGADRVTVQGLQLVSVDPAQNLMVVRGAVPGAVGSLIEIRGAK